MNEDSDAFEPEEFSNLLKGSKSVRTKDNKSVRLGSTQTAN